MRAHKRIPYIRQAFNKEVEAAAQRNETLYDRIALIRHTSSLYRDIESSYLNDRIACIRQSSSLHQNIITDPFSKRIESTRQAFNQAIQFNRIDKDREIGMARRTADEEVPLPGSPVQSLTSQEAPSSRDPSPPPPPPPPPPQKTIRTRLKIDKQVELLEICTRWIGHYTPDKNGGKAFWDKVHEVFESAGSRYSADSCKTFIQGRMLVWDQRAPIEEELEEPLRAWILAVDGRKREEREQKIEEEKAKKEKADKRKADKEKADRKKANKERAEKEKVDKEKATKRSGSKKPVASKKPDHEEGLAETGDTSIPSIESDLPKHNLSDITRVGELPGKKRRTRSFIDEGPAQVTRQTRATSLQAWSTQRKPSVPPGSGAKPAAKPTVAIPSSTTGEKRKRPAPKASEDDAPGPSARPKKKVKTTNDFLEELTNGLEGHLIRIEENIGGKFEELKKELGGLKEEVTNLTEWHVQLNEAINNERGIVVRGSTDEVSKTSEVVTNTMAEIEEIEETDESKTNESDAEIIEDSVHTTQGAGLETIVETTETSILREEGEEQTTYRGAPPRADAPTAESSGDDPISTSDEDENVLPTFSTKIAQYS